MHIFPHCGHTVIKFLTVLNKALALFHLHLPLWVSGFLRIWLSACWTGERTIASPRVAAVVDDFSKWPFYCFSFSVFFVFCPLVSQTGHNQRLFMKYFIIYAHFAVVTFDQLANDARGTSTLTISDLRKLYVKPKGQKRRWSIAERQIEMDRKTNRLRTGILLWTFPYKYIYEVRKLSPKPQLRHRNWLDSLRLEIIYKCADLFPSQKERASRQEG